MISFVYSAFAYFVMIFVSILMLFNGKIFEKIYKNHKKLSLKNKAVISVLLSILLLGVFYKIIFGIFSEPSLLTVMLCVSYGLSIVLNNEALKMDKKALNLFAGFAFFLILTSIGVFIDFNIDFYHHYIDEKSLLIHYTLFGLLFIIATFLDKKCILLAWGCLLGFVFGVMNSGFILDYVADFWQFMFAIILFVKFLKGVVCRFLGAKH